MSRPSTAQCARLKTAIAEEVGNIQAMSERYIAEANDYLVQRIPQGSFDNRQGVEPRKVRYSTAPVADYEYGDLLTQGNEEGTMSARDNCTGAETEQDAIIDTKGAFGCNLPGSTIPCGYDEFTRTLKGKAWETEPFCAMDLLLKKHYNEYIDMLRRDLPRRAQEQFGYSLERNVIDFGFYNTSVVDGFVHSRGQFPAVPTGVLDLGTVRRVFAILGAQGWKGMPEVGPISHEAFETMRRNYKAKEGVELESTLVSPETRHLAMDTQVVEWGGIRWVLTPRPLRGYLSTNPDGTSKFVPVRPTIARQGTGEGIVTDINPDYFDCHTICNGSKKELYEVGFYVDPMAATREAFAMPQVGGKRWANNLFNFQVNMIDGAYLDCNEDNFKGKFRLLHAYAFESLWPELMGAILYRVSPDEVNAVGPKCEDDCKPSPGAEVDIAKPGGPPNNACAEEDCDATACDDEPTNFIDPLPTEEDNCPTPDEGVIKLATCGPVVTDTEAGEVCIYVERSGGSLGAATVDYDSNNGTAVAGTDFTDVTGTLSWADGENDVKKVCVPIIDTGVGGTYFTFSLSGVTGS
jgi:hypothetical protein